MFLEPETDICVPILSKFFLRCHQEARFVPGFVVLLPHWPRKRFILITQVSGFCDSSS